MKVDAIIRAVQESGGSEGLGELKAELQQGIVTHLGSGEMSAREAAATFRIRQGTTEKAGVETAGFAEAVKALEEEPQDARVGLFHFKAPGKLFTVFAVDGRVVGCVRLRQEDEYPSPS
jgi:hypothetical protein